MGNYGVRGQRSLRLMHHQEPKPAFKDNHTDVRISTSEQKNGNKNKITKMSSREALPRKVSVFNGCSASASAGAKLFRMNC